MSREILQDIIDYFAPDKFIRFFREKNRSFAPRQESFAQYNDDGFTNGAKLGEIQFPASEKLIISTFQANQPLSERSGKKAQYEKGKRILKDTQSDAGIFIFYDQQGNFRFSLIYANYLGRRRDWSTFRRFTYFVSKEFTNKTFLQRIGEGDFSTLEKIKEAFSVEKVTKDFYKDIANWYFWAVQNVTFPKDAEKEANGRNIAVIRMITRLIFIWFMKQRGLISNDLFNCKNVSAFLKDIGSRETTYYKAILQNLFFATLNAKIRDRKFRFNKSFQGKNKDYMDHSIYRYENYFKNQKDMLVVFKDIPFLNGGLFDCLDRRITEDQKNIEIRIDGFTDREVGLKVPNFLFFSGEINADLNKEYGTKGKKYKVRGLIDTLFAYNFTIDENEPNDQEVALDPELLGKVFENLLASFNPETATTARKATGSYYTPREIVDYMVTQSLKEYFKTHLKDIDGLDDKLESLFSHDNEENPFSKTDTPRIVKLIDNLRIVDPAVGSGAFPMGVLNKLVFILSKLDPDNTLWKETQIKAVEESVPDPVIKQKLKESIIKQFAEKNFDYGRKLYLIQKCIYGVDIQQIAVEIAKLRFFIALLVDEKIEKNKENWGIEPLPNMDYKIIQGNSLIEYLSPDVMKKGTNVEKNDLIDKLNDLKTKYFSAANQNEKEKLKTQINDLTESLINYDFYYVKRQIAGILGQQPLIAPVNNKMDLPEAKKAKQLTKKEDALKKIEKLCPEDHFEWHINFNEIFEKNGFDVVIANPPYLKERDNKKIFEAINKSAWGKKWHQGKMDYWFYFLHRAIDISKRKGVISYITSRYWLNSMGAKKLIERVRNELSFVNIVDIGKLKVFDNVAGQHMVSVFIKCKDIDRFKYKRIISDISNIMLENASSKVQILELYNDDIFVNDEILLQEKQIKYIDTIQLGEITDISQGVVEAPAQLSKSHFKKSKRKDVSMGDGVFVLTIDELKKLRLNEDEKSVIKKYIDPNDVKKYKIDWNNKYLIYSNKELRENIKRNPKYSTLKKHLDKYKNFITSSNRPYGLHRPRDIKYFNSPKLIFKGMFANNEVAYDDDEYYFGFSFASIITKDLNYDLKYILALLNSGFALNWFYINGKRRGGGVDIGIEKLRQFPIKILVAHEQKPIINTVDKILAITKSDDYIDNKEKHTKVNRLEKQIDQMVYKLYGLTEEEIEVVEGKNDQ